ncbi:unnamed protein product [Linum trigynum]|uniref:Uncharacterized protein n=1 Tax=Linum trigynum TaxID=586398 RepID=A0AAV2F8B4_9ROSI
MWPYRLPQHHLESVLPPRSTLRLESLLLRANSSEFHLRLLESMMPDVIHTMWRRSYSELRVSLSLNLIGICPLLARNSHHQS